MVLTYTTESESLAPSELLVGALVIVKVIFPPSVRASSAVAALDEIE